MTSKIYNLIVLLFVSLVAIGQNRDANTSLISIGGLGSIDSGSVTFTNNYLPFIKVIIDNVGSAVFYGELGKKLT